MKHLGPTARAVRTLICRIFLSFVAKILHTLVLPCSVLSTIYYQLLLLGIVVDDNYC